jgi:hypothetical protein
VNVVVIDTTAYSVIIGNEWLSKTRATVDWNQMNATLRWYYGKTAYLFAVGPAMALLLYEKAKTKKKVRFQRDDEEEDAMFAYEQPAEVTVFLEHIRPHEYPALIYGLPGTVGTAEVPTRSASALQYAGT